MSDVTAVPPHAPSAPADERVARPLRAGIDGSGRLCLAPDESIRVVLALKHLAAFVHWSPAARDYDDAIAEEAEWMAESLGDLALSARGGLQRTT